MDIREATPEDNSALIDLQSRCPQGTTIIVSTVNTPDFFARAKVYEDYKVFVCCEGNRIIASSACGLHNAMIKDKVEKVGYEFQAFVDPDYRGRRIAGQLQQVREDYIRSKGAALSYGFIIEGNIPSMRYIERRGFTRYDTVVMPAIAVYREMKVRQEGNVRIMTVNDLPAVTRLLNDTWQKYELYEPVTAESLVALIERIPEYGMGDIQVLEEDGEITACLGIWDWSRVMEVTVNALNSKMEVMGLFMSLAGLITKVPSIPRPGSRLKQTALTQIGFKDISALSTLLRHANNRAYQAGIQQIFCISSRKAPMLGALKGFIHIDTLMHMNIKPLMEGVTLSGKPVYVSGLDL
jgi:N-acetylglutamate synthase-like GNAT family acetyltransferase